VRLRAAAVVRLEGALAHDRTPSVGAAVRRGTWFREWNLQRAINGLCTTARPAPGRRSTECTNAITVRIRAPNGQTGRHTNRPQYGRRGTTRRRHAGAYCRSPFGAVRFAHRWAIAGWAPHRGNAGCTPYTGCGQVCGWGALTSP
jgi:hypothetical protein